AKTRFHQGLSRQQNWYGNNNARIDAVVPKQTAQEIWMEQRSEDYERDPADGQREDHPSAVVPAIGPDESRSLLQAIKRASADQGEPLVRCAACHNFRLRNYIV